MEETTNYKGYGIIVETLDYLDDHDNPRTWDNLGTMVCFNSRYNLGDEQFTDPIDWLEDKLELEPEHEYTDERRQELEEKLEKDYIVLPLYLYDHSGITMNTTGFGCRWDSGQVGYIFMSRADARKEFAWGRITKKREEHVEKCLRGEVETYDNYLTGDIYRFEVLDPEGEHVDGCGGYYGYPEGFEQAMEEAKGAVNHDIALRRKARIEKLKELIRNNVPILKRPELLPDL